MSPIFFLPYQKRLFLLPNPFILVFTPSAHHLPPTPLWYKSSSTSRTSSLPSLAFKKKKKNRHKSHRENGSALPVRCHVCHLPQLPGFSPENWFLFNSAAHWSRGEPHYAESLHRSPGAPCRAILLFFLFDTRSGRVAGLIRASKKILHKF